jgi:hypothetical protein
LVTALPPQLPSVAMPTLQPFCQAKNFGNVEFYASAIRVRVLFALFRVLDSSCLAPVAVEVFIYYRTVVRIKTIALRMHFRICFYDRTIETFRINELHTKRYDSRTK